MVIFDCKYRMYPLYNEKGENAYVQVFIDLSSRSLRTCFPIVNQYFMCDTLFVYKGHRVWNHCLGNDKHCIHRQRQMFFLGYN